MTRTTLRTALAAFCGATLLTACPDDLPSVSTSDGSTSGDDSTSGDPTTPVTASDGPSGVTTDDTRGESTTDESTTGGEDTTGEGTTGEGTTGEGTTGEGTTGEGTTGEGTTGEGTTGEGTTGEGTTGEGSESSSSTGMMDAFPCDDEDLGSMVPLTVAGSTVGLADDFAASCAFMGGNDEDVVYQWTAPADGTYVFDTLGSGIDTILTALSDCEGTELACNDDEPNGSLQSQFTLDMTADETILIVVDGWNESGDFTLNITEFEDPFPCDDVDLGSMVPQTVEGTTVGSVDDFAASCAFMGGNDEDVVHLWTAPADGTYVFDTLGSGIDTILTVLSDCDGTELGCNDDEPNGSLQSEVILDMTAGQTVLLTVDGWNETGDYTLNIAEQVPPPPAGFTSCDGGVTCPVAGELCFGDGMMTVDVCTFVGCAVAADCTPPDPALGGDAPVTCSDLNGDMIAEECGLDCSGGQTCPTGMECLAGFICVWPSAP